MPEIETLDVSYSRKVQYILGIAAGEGCFLVDLSHNPDKYKFNVAVTPAFKVQMDEDDLRMLEYLRDETGLGTVHVDASSAMAVWQVYDTEHTRELAALIEEEASEAFKLSKKYDSFQRWKAVLDAKDPYEHFNSAEEVEELVRLAKQVNDTNRGLSTQEWVDRVYNNE
jgi:uncharacterized protein involved in type VI secretion and phage assembly